MNRRTLLACGALAGVAAAAGRAGWAASGPLAAIPGPRVQLLREGGAPVRASGLAPHRSYVFPYPFESTPCFLLSLGRPVPGTRVPIGREGGDYAWTGGVGRERGVVAYSAICSHLYTHPTRDVAMIHYYGPDATATVAQRPGVIACCVHGSTFDPERGGVPLQPPAELPLAAVLLEWEPASDALWAAGLAGRPVFEEFFRSFPKSDRQEVRSGVQVLELERYSRTVLSC